MKKIYFLIFTLVLLVSNSCNDTNMTDNPEMPTFAIAIHGGAGVISKDIPSELRDQYVNSLDNVLHIGRDMLENGASGLDVVIAVITLLEDDPLFNAGRGAVMTNEATFELDASIMDGSTLSAGAVAGVKTVKNPIILARHVMENSRHVLLSGDGAERFADLMQVERVDSSWFFTERRYEQLKIAQQRDEVTLSEQTNLPESFRMGTVGVAVLDSYGNLASGTSTGGMTNKRFGRIGDSPIIGAGTYANNATCAVSATGTGEQFIRHAVAHQISAIMEYTGASLQEAAEKVIYKKLNPGDGGIVAVSHTGEIAMVFNSLGMYRAAADSKGRYEVKIWD